MKNHGDSKKYFFLILFSAILVISPVKAQVGIDLLCAQQTFTNWNEVINNHQSGDYSFLRFNYGAGVNYWFRLKNYRVEFTPGIYYLYSDFKSDSQNYSYIYHNHTGGIEFDCNIYPFDFLKKSYEKDCPSFSTKGEYFPKSFFFQVSPGILGSFRDVSQEYLKEFDISGKLDFGIGLDMKLTHRIILAPIIKYGLTFDNDWRGFSEFHAEESYNDNTPGSYFSFILSFYLK